MRKNKIICMAFMDPICSYCYGTDPELKKFESLYKDVVDVRYYIGGLLSSWEDYQEAGGVVTKPEDVYAHWLEVGKELGIEINASVWLTDPIQSSEPPSLFYRAVVMQQPQKGAIFLEKIKQALFVHGKRTDDYSFLLAVCKEIGCDVEEIKKALDDGSAKRIFQHEMIIANNFDVQLFPTFIITDQSKMVRLEGYTTFDEFVRGLNMMDPTLNQKLKHEAF